MTIKFELIESYDKSEFTNECTKLLNTGWKLAGNFSICSIPPIGVGFGNNVCYSQTFIKEDPQNPPILNESK